MTSKPKYRKTKVKGRHAIAYVHVKGIGTYSQSRHIHDKKEDRETSNEFDERMWRQHGHYDSDGLVVIPTAGIKQCIFDCAKNMSEKIEGKGGNKWTKHFQSGLAMTDDSVPILDGKGKRIHMDELEHVRINAHANGNRTSGTRVPRRFPVIPEWQAEFEVLITDPIIQEDVFERYVVLSGINIGIGRWRPQNGGENGRFSVEGFAWKTL